MLIISRKPGEKFYLNEEIEVTILEVAGDKIKIGINAPKNVRIIRGELLETRNANIEAQESAKGQGFDLLKDKVHKIEKKH